jgi:hypothetical protein
MGKASGHRRNPRAIKRLVSVSATKNATISLIGKAWILREGAPFSRAFNYFQLKV